MIVNANNLAILTRGYNASFKKSFRSFSTTSAWAKVATLIRTGNIKTVDYSWLDHFPKLREWIGDRHVKNLAQHDYSRVNLPFEATVGVKSEEIRRDQYSVYNTIFEDMGKSAAEWPDDLVFELLAAGATTLCYDGQNFLDTDHPMGTSTAANYSVTGGGNLWLLMDTRRPLKPLIFQREMAPKLLTMNMDTDEAVFSRREFRYGIEAWGNAGFGFWQQAYGSLDTINETNVDTYIAAMAALESDEGKNLGINPNVLICGYSRRTEALDFLDRQVLAAGETNRSYKSLDLILTHYLT